jgi:hypothetical protein
VVASNGAAMRGDKPAKAVVIGAGSVGLAAAACVLIRGPTRVLVDQAPGVGHSIRQWSHVRMFSPWRYSVDRAARALPEPTGRRPPPGNSLPVGGEFVSQYLTPLAEAIARMARVEINRRVVSIGRLDFDKARTDWHEKQPLEPVLSRDDGLDETRLAYVLIDASGTRFQPDRMGAGGFPMRGEKTFNRHIRYGAPDIPGAERERYAGRQTIVMSSEHSSLNALNDLVRLKRELPWTEILWGLGQDGVETKFGADAGDRPPKRGAIGLRTQAAPDAGLLEVRSDIRARRLERSGRRPITLVGASVLEPARVNVDEIIVATGPRPDLRMIRELRTNADAALECAKALTPLIDPNIHGGGTVRPHGARELLHPEPDFFIAGMKSYGRASSFLMASGDEQAGSIAAATTVDGDAADRADLELPDAGVCNSTQDGTNSCCRRALAVDELPKSAAATVGCCAGKAAVVPKKPATCCG